MGLRGRAPCEAAHGMEGDADVCWPQRRLLSLQWSSRSWPTASWGWEDGRVCAKCRRQDCRTFRSFPPPLGARSLSHMVLSGWLGLERRPSAHPLLRATSWSDTWIRVSHAWPQSRALVLGWFARLHHGMQTLER